MSSRRWGQVFLLNNFAFRRWQFLVISSDRWGQVFLLNIFLLGDDETVIEHVVSAQREELEIEIADLKSEAEREPAEERELAGEVPFQPCYKQNLVKTFAIES